MQVNRRKKNPAISTVYILVYIIQECITKLVRSPLDTNNNKWTN